MNSSAPQTAQPSMMPSDCLLAHLKSCVRGIFRSNDRVCWLVTRGLESYLTTWSIQGWRPPGADTAIRPLRVDGWFAPTATLVPSSRTIIVSLGFFVSVQRGKIVPVSKGKIGPGFLSLVQGSPLETWA